MTLRRELAEVTRKNHAIQYELDYVKEKNRAELEVKDKKLQQTTSVLELSKQRVFSLELMISQKDIELHRRDEQINRLTAQLSYKK
jgi:hypothetical protein